MNLVQSYPPSPLESIKKRLDSNRSVMVLLLESGRALNQRPGRRNWMDNLFIYNDFYLSREEVPVYERFSTDNFATPPRNLEHARRLQLWFSAVVIVLALLIGNTIRPDLFPLSDHHAVLGPMTILLLFCSALACEYIDSSLGMGYGTTLTPLLLLAGFEPLRIVPAVLLSEFVSGIGAALMHQRDGNIDFLRDSRARKTALMLCALSILGVTLAVSIAIRIPKFWLTFAIASIILTVGIAIIATGRRQLAYRRRHIIVFGAVAAFNKALSGGGYGPLVTGGQVVSGVSAKQAVAITSLAEGLTCFVGLVAYTIVRGLPDWWLAIPLTLGAVLSVPMATLTVKKLPESFLRRSVGIVTLLLGTLTLIKLFS